VENGKFKVYGNPIKFSWFVMGKRSDIEIEPNKNDVEVYGSGPYRWIKK
jgi:hypothetical protein